MGLPLYSVAQLRAAEAAAAASLPAGTLMARAGAIAARHIAQRIGERRRVAVVCGGGNNGGDGYVTAARLAEHGHAVVVWALAEPATEDARAAAAAWRAAGGGVVEGIGTQQSFDAVVDAVLGIGQTRPLAGHYLEAVRWINARSRRAVFALDVPSGLDADRGSWVGAVPGVEAGTTITFLGAKPGLFTGTGCDAAGQVLIETLGVELPPTPVWRTDPADFASVCQPRRRDTHKGTYGTLGVLGGNVGMVGAALLAARAALRLGAGRVHVECLGAQELRLDPQQPELMFRTLATVPVLDAVVVGCGLGADRAAHEALASALARPTALVLDADALNLVAGAATLAAGLRERRAATVLTPHPLEAARLLGIDAADVQRDRVQAARELAARTGALAMLKGAGTVVAHSDGRAWINPTGGPALATPGSGDVLAGMIGALLAQRFDPVEATLAAVWLHGAAADRYGGDVGLTAAEIAPLAVRRLVELRQAASA